MEGSEPNLALRLETLDEDELLQVALEGSDPQVQPLKQDRGIEGGSRRDNLAADLIQLGTEQVNAFPGKL